MQSSFSNLSSLFTVPVYFNAFGIAQEYQITYHLVEGENKFSLNLCRRRVRRQCILSNSNLQKAPCLLCISRPGFEILVFWHILRVALSKLKNWPEAIFRKYAAAVFKYCQSSKFNYRPQVYPNVLFNSVAAAASTWNKRHSSHSLKSLPLPSTSPYSETGENPFKLKTNSE
ncbi:hypothetical protein CEXT_287741 [Caerostris extrusa]|uniref:Uncharacterized protein n=1 Tax=Caerostris extrusa TaxID=172846 RepID=A0AAV4YAN3_CAEEX|nr:hypothetical protein CEXT_287741 [Caerostris extrusa]